MIDTEQAAENVIGEVREEVGEWPLRRRVKAKVAMGLFAAGAKIAPGELSATAVEAAKSELSEQLFSPFADEDS